MHGETEPGADVVDAGPGATFALLGTIVTAVAVAIAAVAEGWWVPARSGEAGLPGRAAALYASEAAAKQRCEGQAVVFADDKRRIFVAAGDPAYGKWDGAALPDRGFGCSEDLRADKFDTSP